MRLLEVMPASQPFLGSVISVLRAQGEPYAGASIHAQFALMAAARSHGLKVLLDGQGADELLAGYPPYLGLQTAGLLASGHPIAALRDFRDQVRRGPLGMKASVGLVGRALLRGRPIELIRSASAGRLAIRCEPVLAREPPLDRPGEVRGTRLARRLWRDLTADSLPGLLRYEDRNSMAFGIEARVPFLDVRLVDHALALPDRLKISGGETKIALRRAMRGRLPDRVVNRRDKVAFAAPEGAWLAASRPELGHLLLDGQLVRRGWIARRELENALDSHLGQSRHHEQLWRLLVVEAWLRLMWPDAGSAGGSSIWQRALESESAARSSLIGES
jgi:asparagine synthase (glutamine-hydrolysing)